MGLDYRWGLVLVASCLGFFFWFQSQPVSCVVSGRIGPAERHAPMRGHSNSSSNFTDPDRLLVIVIAGGSRGLVYPSYRSIWSDVADRVASFGVHIYLVNLDPGVTDTVFANHQITFRGVDTAVPGVLNETLLGLDYVYANKLPGSQAPYVLRTNLSSFWQFNKLLTWLKSQAASLVAAFIGGFGDGAFPSGAGTLMSVDNCKMMLALPRDVLVNSTQPDDIVIGEALRKAYPITPMKRTDLVAGPPPNIGGLLNAAPDIFHYRIKSEDQLRDIGVMQWLYSDWYETGKIASATTNQWKFTS